MTLYSRIDVVNPKAFTVSHVVTPKKAGPKSSHQLNPAALRTMELSNITAHAGYV